MKIKAAIALNAFVFVVAAAGMSTLAQAQDGGYYVGVASGQSNFADDFCSGATSCDNISTGLRIFGGYQFNRYFGAELGYVNLGKGSASGMVGATPVSAEFKANGWEFVGVATLPITGNFSAYGKLGFFRWDVDSSGSVSSVSTASFSETGSDLTFGVGLKYDFSRNIAARLELQRYNDLGKSATTGQSDVDLFSLGIVFKF